MTWKGRVITRRKWRKKGERRCTGRGRKRGSDGKKRKIKKNSRKNHNWRKRRW